MKKINIIRRSLEQVRKWRCPPHWQPDDWREELIAVAWAALWEGLNNGIRSEEKLQKFVIAALMKRYRDEWNYGVRWIQSPLPQNNDDNDGDENGWDLWDWVGSEMEDTDSRWEVKWYTTVVRYALSKLSKEDRYLIERKFWDGATERELAQELGISQPAVHKKIHKALEQLRQILD